MKKFFLVVALLPVLNGFAQFNKGTRTVGFNIAGIGFTANSTTYDYGQSGILGSKNSSANISISPSIGKFISDKLLVGGNLNINFNHTKYKAGINDETGNSFTFGAGGFGRYYFGNSGFMPYAQGALGLAYGSGKFSWVRDYRNVVNPYLEKGNADQKGIFSVNAGLSLGFTKMVNKNIGFDLGVGYVFNNYNYNYKSVANKEYSNPSSSEQVKGEYKYSNNSNGVSFNLGFLIFLDPKK